VATGTREFPRWTAADSVRVESTLKATRTVTMQRLLELLPDKEPRRYLYDLMPLYPSRSGKGLRPALCIATCRAFGGSLEDVLDTAVAVELFHNAFLIHDDVEDGSEARRGLPTLSAQHGLPIAVNVGDAMNVMSIRPLMSNLHRLGPRVTWTVFEEIEHMVRQSVEGQALELGWVRDNLCEEIDEADYLRMILKKTCFYTCIHPCRLGALVAQGCGADLDRFNRYGYYMGAAFQIQDDMLNLVGDMARYGKEIGGDILEGKRTLMLIHLLQNCPNRTRKRLHEFLGVLRSQRTVSDARWVFGQMQRYGSIEHARSTARILAGAALREYAAVYGLLPPSDDRDFLRDVVLYMVERDL
jgi:geranylgeranyl diphosphate synthase, type II